MPSEIIICVALCMFMDGKLVEHIEEKGETQGRIRILEVLDHGYESDSYEAESRY